MEYAFKHEGKGFLPSGSEPIPAEQVDAHNKELERAELELLKTGPDSLFLYVKHPDKTYAGLGVCGPVDSAYWWKITTWPGTIVCECAHVGPQYKIPGFGCWPSKRRPVSAVIFGTLYHGTYYESSGSYCRLRKAKIQYPAWRKKHEPKNVKEVSE